MVKVRFLWNCQEEEEEELTGLKIRMHSGGGR